MVGIVLKSLAGAHGMPVPHESTFPSFFASSWTMPWRSAIFQSFLVALGGKL